MVLGCLVVTACAGAPSAKTITNHPIPAASQTQLTGTKLKSTLLPLSGFPAGTEVDTQSGSDSGPALLTSRQDLTPPVLDCQHSGQSLITATVGFTAGATQLLYDATLDHPSSYHQRRYGQVVFQFATASRSTEFFDWIRSTFTRCPSVTTTEGNATAVVKQTVSPASPVAGHQTLLVRQTGTVKGVNVDAVALVTIDGTDVYQLSETVFGLPLASQPSSLAALTEKLIARVHAYKCELACTTSGGSD